MNCKRALGIFFSFFVFIIATFSQEVCIEIVDLPMGTPANSKFFISGNFNDWELKGYEFTKNGSDNFEVCIQTSLDTLIYKLHRGDWEKVEGTGVGSQRPDRKTAVNRLDNEKVLCQVHGWEDQRSDSLARIFVVDLSGTTPEGEDLYVSGNFVGWYPDRPEFRLNKVIGNKYLAEVPIFSDSVFYKYTRGTWEKVEGNDIGLHSANRFLKVNNKGEYYDTIVSWEDIRPANRYDIILESLPKNTPKDASIFISGNMNGWTTDDATYLFKRTDQGYRLSFFSQLDTIQYKFNRGDWEAVEGGINGLAIQNRQVIHAETNFPVRVKVRSWEDISAKKFNIYTMSLIIPVVIGMLLLLALNGLKHQQVANAYLRLLLVFLCVSIVFRVLTYYKEVFNWYPQLIVVSDMIYFLIGPSLYLYVNALLSEEKASVRSLKSFLPFLILTVLYLPFFTIEKEGFILRTVNRDFRWVFALSGFIGLLINIFYWFTCAKANQTYQNRVNNHLSYDIKDNYLQYILSLSAIILFFWAMVYLSAVVGWLLSVPSATISNTLVDICWLLSTFYVYLFGFFAIQKPEIFKVLSSSQDVEEKDEVESEEIDSLKKELITVMDNDKLFLNSELSLNDLAESMGAGDQLVSKVINDGLKMNFYDYINSLRVREFIDRVKHGQGQNKTYLAIAYEVGFNSKSTFNRAFKKIEHMTPREFFKKNLNGE